MWKIGAAFLVSAMTLFPAWTPAFADTIVDCSAVSDRATASAKTGITIQLATSGKTCNFSMDGAATTKSLIPENSTYDRLWQSQPFRELASSISEGNIYGLSEQSIMILTMAPFTEVDYLDSIAVQNTDVFDLNGRLGDCISGDGDRMGSRFFQAGSFEAFACGYIDPDESESPIDITLPGTEGFVEVSGTNRVFVLAFEFDEVAYYFITDYASLRSAISN